jgi:shikimate 5-dehydrogenase
MNRINNSSTMIKNRINNNSSTMMNNRAYSSLGLAYKYKRKE